MEWDTMIVSGISLGLCEGWFHHYISNSYNINVFNKPIIDCSFHFHSQQIDSRIQIQKATITKHSFLCGKWRNNITLNLRHGFRFILNNKFMRLLDCVCKKNATNQKRSFKNALLSFRMNESSEGERRRCRNERACQGTRIVCGGPCSMSFEGNRRNQ